MNRNQSPNRHRLMNALATYLERFPDMRVGQVIGNATYAIRGAYDPYYIEDGDMADAIERLMSE